MTAPMEMLVDTLIEAPGWDGIDLAGLGERAGRAVLADLGLDAAGFEICLMGCDDARIAELNADFRGKPQPTNVLSWPSEERGAAVDGDAPDRPEPGMAMMPESLGDIAIAFETCAREAAEQGKDFESHVMHLLVHGTLHLLGYDHIRDGDAALMEAAEIRILDRMGIANPYD